jgi:hypothetical protein
MVMPAQQPQGMSISDILSLAQLAKQGQQTGVNTPVEQQNMPEMTYTRESGSPVQNGAFVPPQPPKPELNQAQNVGLWDTIKGYFGG